MRCDSLGQPSSRDVGTRSRKDKAHPQERRNPLLKLSVHANESSHRRVRNRMKAEVFQTMARHSWTCLDQPLKHPKYNDNWKRTILWIATIL